jgi:hypothetical protein
LDTRDVGSKVVGKLKCIKFKPWESTRPEITPDILVAYCEESNKISYMDCQRARILNELTTGLPVDIPSADSVEATLGLEYDVDIIYAGDPGGEKRYHLDKTLGYCGWSATIDKKTAKFSLHKLIQVPCKTRILRVLVTIINANKNKETLFLTADLPKMLVYIATRPTDPDYKLLLEKYA